jgi:hypothetical protein
MAKQDFSFMHSFVRGAGILLLLATSACSTVIEGRTQKIAVDTYPSGADCVIKDNDLILAKVHTPGTAEINKSKNDILVECTKEGYIPNKKRNRSDVAITSFGNMAFGKLSFVGNMVDSASGASNKYDSKVFMGLNPLPSVAQISDAEVSVHATATQGISSATDLASMPPEQLAQELAHMLKTQKVIVTRQSPEEVIRLLMNHQPVTGETVEGMNAADQQVAL